MSLTEQVATASKVGRGRGILARLRQEFALTAGQTTPDHKLSLNTARCLGSCGLAPVLVLNGEVVGFAWWRSKSATSCKLSVAN